MVKENVGKGQRVCGNFGEAGFRERVDFKQIIGDYARKDEITKTIEYLPTTKGINHYAKNAEAHLVPSDPGALTP